MEQMKRKLLMAGLSLTVAVVMMVTASMAWMTISTKPEISSIQVTLYTKQTLLSSSNNQNYVQYLDISEQFKNLAPLRPASTTDGVNWFIPTYNEVVNPKDDDQTDDGALNAASEFVLDDSLKYANVSIAGKTGDELREAIRNGYYVYADFWLKTEEEGCKVRLSVPESKSSLQSGEEKTGKYGSYVLAGEEQMTVEGNRAGFMSTREAESCVRVGFLFTDPQTQTKKFIIYEPNADQRSSEEKPTDHTYVHGYTFDAGSYKDGNYIKTQPIGKDGNGKGKEQNLMPDQLIIQKKSEWGSGAAAKFSAGETPSSNEVNTLGKFLSPAGIYNAGGTAVAVAGQTGDIGSDVLMTLKQDVPVEVRMFIWLEGQDVDCWNDIAAGSFVVNLELAGETMLPAENE